MRKWNRDNTRYGERFTRDRYEQRPGKSRVPCEGSSTTVVVQSRLPTQLRVVLGIERSIHYRTDHNQSVAPEVDEETSPKKVPDSNLPTSGKKEKD